MNHNYRLEDPLTPHNEDEGQGSAERGSKRRVVSIASLEALGPPPPVRWLWRGVVPVGEVTIIAGDGGIGKGILTSQLAVAVATGSGLFGAETSRGATILVNAEDTLDRMHRSVAEAAVGSSSGRAALASIHVLSLKDEVDPRLLVDGKPSSIFQTIEQAVADIRPALLVLDPAADLFGGNPLDAAAVNGFMRHLAALADRMGLAVVLVTHVSVAGAAEGSGRSGLVNWSNKARARLYLRRPERGAGADAFARVLSVTKANLGPLGQEWNLRFDAGRFIEADPTPPKPEKARFNKAERVAIAALESVTNASCHALVEEWRVSMYAMLGDKDIAAKRQDFNRAKKRLSLQGLITIDAESVTVTTRDIFTVCHGVTQEDGKRDKRDSPPKGGTVLSRPLSRSPSLPRKTKTKGARVSAARP